MSFPRYPKYKASGIGWLGDLPEHWELKPLFGCAFERYESNKGMLEDNLLSLSYGNIIPKDLKANDGLLPDSFETYQIVRQGDIIFRLTDLQNDKRSLRTGLVKENGIITSAYLAVAPRGPDSFFMAYLCRAYDLTKVFYSMGGGVRQTMKFADMKRLPTVLPPIPEQVTIAAFLDRETAKIDELVAEQRRLMELLKEKRQAVISHAVTKGVNPHAPMKPSGVEWLGDVPAGWRIVQLSMLAKMIQTGPFGSQLHSEDYVENGTPVINPSNIQDGKIEPDWSCSITAEDANRLSQHKLIDGDIVFGRRGEMGRCALVSANEVGWICGTGSLNVRLLPEAFPPFISIYLRTEYVREWLKLESVGSTMDNLNTQILGAIKLPLPNLSEQTAIFEFLEIETARFDTLTAEAQRAIDLLQERRTALISAAVTGQIDVRNQPRN